MYNHLLGQLQFFQCYHIFLYNFLIVDQKRSVYHNIEIFYFWFWWKIVSVCTFLCWNDTTKSCLDIGFVFLLTLFIERTHCSCQTRTRIISQLIKDISRVFDKIIKHFNDNAISNIFVLPSTGILPVIQILIWII